MGTRTFFQFEIIINETYACRTGQTLRLNLPFLRMPLLCLRTSRTYLPINNMNYTTFMAIRTLRSK